MFPSLHSQVPFSISTPVIIGIMMAALIFRLTDAATCPSCGNMTVPYPLSTSSNCGDQRYKVVCSPQKQLSFKAVSGSYPVVSIQPSSQRLVIGAPSISSSTCATTDLQSGGLVLNQSLPFNVTSSNTVLLLNCSSKLLLSPLNCSSNNLCSQFLAQESDGKACQNKLCCTFTAGGSSTSYQITVANGDCTAYTSVLALNPSTNAKSWSYGVELEWVIPPEPVCTSQKDCGQDSTCQRDPKTNGLRCLCNSGYRWDGSSGLCSALLCGQGKCGTQHKAAIIAGITVALAASILATCLIWYVCRRRRLAKEARDKLSKDRQEILSAGCGGKSAKLYTTGQMRRATQGFAKERLLGSGGFGEVYKGVLDDGTAVAVKIAKLGNIKGVEQVLNEVRILSQVNHRNLVMLLGCCVETQEPLLVYEYISNGTLFEHLHGSRGAFLDWKTRLRIALQTAEGLAYLHSAAYPPIYHRDVKSSNILLDDALNARVSDFGLSKLAQPDLSHISTCAQGTLGYLDPEYYRNYQLTAKSDVYSFGIVLLELVTSQRVIEFGRGQDDVNLAVYVLGRSEAGTAMEVVDRKLLTELGDGCPTNVVHQTIMQVIFLALSCLRDSRLERPSMKEVAEELQQMLNLVALDQDVNIALQTPLDQSSSYSPLESSYSASEILESSSASSILYLTP